MDHVLAKIKRATKKQYFKLLSDHTLYKNIDINVANCIPYSADHNLDEDSWFKVENFSKQNFCIELLKKKFDSKDYSDLKKDQFPKIAYIFSVQSENYYFQKITSSLFIKRKTIAFGEAVAIEENNNRLIINDQPDAIYLNKLDTLIFRNLATISGIFKGIDELYREATQQETKTFLDSPFIELKNDYEADHVSKPNRKRIALAMDALLAMSPQDKVEILSYIDEYCGKKLKFNKTTQQFEISTDDELKILLYGVGQRFYTTLFGKERRLANSVQAVD